MASCICDAYPEAVRAQPERVLASERFRLYARFPNVNDPAAAAAECLTQPQSAQVLIRRPGLTGGEFRIHYQLLLRVAADKDAPVQIEYVTHHPVNSESR